MVLSGTYENIFVHLNIFLVIIFEASISHLRCADILNPLRRGALWGTGVRGTAHDGVGDSCSQNVI